MIFFSEDEENIASIMKDDDIHLLNFDHVETVMADTNGGNGGDIKFSSLLYNALINGFCRMKRIDKAQAIKLFMTKNGCEEMQTKGLSTDEMTYKLIIGGLIREKKLCVACEVWDEMMEKGFTLDGSVSEALINAIHSTDSACGHAHVPLDLSEAGLPTWPVSA
ncbi:hypothetical protein V6N13_005316 [Hibiscus sabdariffa]